MAEGGFGGKDDTGVKSVEEDFTSDERSDNNFVEYQDDDVDLRNIQKNHDRAKIITKVYKKELEYKDMQQFEMNIWESNHDTRLIVPEQQLPTLRSVDPALSIANEDNTRVDGCTLSPDANVLVTSHTGAAQGFPLGSQDSNSTSNDSNLSVSATPAMPHPLGSTQQNRSSNPSNCSCGSSHFTRTRQKVKITDDTEVQECPPTFIKILSDYLNGRRGNLNWKGLLTLCGWSYKDITLFGDREHPNGIFCSILDHEDFQEYTIGELKAHLQDIPRRDLLKQINEWINNYNL